MPVTKPQSARTDFPFYNGQPVALSGRDWALILLGVALGFAALLLPFTNAAARLIPALLFPLVPLLVLRTVAGPSAWRALFKPIRLGDIGLALGIALLNIAVSFTVAWLLTLLFSTNANPVMQLLSQQSAADRSLFLLSTVPQLLGEEVLTILPLLALLTWFHGRLGFSRRKSLVLAWLLSALPFALVHLPTYQWNLAQCLLIIGSARLVLSLAYLRSKNLAVAALAHIMNDWLLFGIAALLGSYAASHS
ncbi:type II CAAX prenyl endopeptidase Rce1 family protein [Comamonas sp.]|uniref:CPBP family glutamic-type intramembrane protease n=1 Tax=Comamonas sp. TaxID=34028 RepID=UPI003A91ABB2